MSDISKKIFPIEPTADEDPIAIVPDIEDDTVSDPQGKAGGPKNSGAESENSLPLRRIDDVPDPVFRPIIHLVKPVEDTQKEGLSEKLTITTEPIAETVSFITDETPETPDKAPEQIVLPQRPSILTPVRVDPPEPERGLGWIGPTLTLLTGLSVGALIVAFVGTDAALTPINLGIIATASIIPMIAALALWICLRAFAKTKSEAVRLAAVSEKLLSVDESVADDVARLSTAIRLELARVEERLSQTRNELEMVATTLTKQFADADSLVRGISSRSERIATAASEQRKSVQDMSGLIETRLSALTEKLVQTGKDVSELTQAASDCIDRSTDTLKTSTVTSAEQADQLVEQTQRLLQAQKEIETKIADLGSTYEKRIKQTEGLVKRLSSEASDADQSLTQQSVHLTSVNSQIESMGSRLTALIEQAKSVQDELTSRLSDINATLVDADQRSKDFTSDISERIEESLSQTRRDLYSIDRDVRALHDRMHQTQITPPTITPSRPEPLTITPEPKRPSAPSPSQLDLTPIEDTFTDDLAIPQIDETSAFDADDDQILTLTQPIEAFDQAQDGNSGNSDIVTRPGNVEAPINPKPQDKNWRWRDMLGGLDHQASPPDTGEAKRVHRPGPGVPLSPPTTPRVSVDGSDVVSRLRDVELPPAQAVDDLVIQKAVSARMSGGEDAQSSAVFAHLNTSLIHLRGVFAADPKFRSRAEGFRREYDAALRGIGNSADLSKALSTDSGRAYLLCAAAFFSV